MLTKKQFEILAYLADNKEVVSQRNIASNTSMSVGSVNKILSEMMELGYVSNNQITDSGLQALEPYRVKRAIIMAAGLGSRMMPITLNTPKPLIRVKGKRIIETLLDALIEVGITEIYIVRGYLAKQFDELLYKYPTIKFIENEKYNEGNNIVSILLAKEYLPNTYILEADLLLYNKKIISKYQYGSNYLGIPVEETNDWCLFTNNNVISGYAIGGKDCYKLAGISYWTEKDGKQLAEDITKAYNAPGGAERYWDQVPLDYSINNYQLYVRTCTEGDIIEIDTFNELKAIDPIYNL